MLLKVVTCVLAVLLLVAFCIWILIGRSKEESYKPIKRILDVVLLALAGFMIVCSARLYVNNERAVLKKAQEAVEKKEEREEKNDEDDKDKTDEPDDGSITSGDDENTDSEGNTIPGSEEGDDGSVKTGGDEVPAEGGDDNSEGEISISGDDVDPGKAEITDPVTEEINDQETPQAPEPSKSIFDILKP